MKKAARRIRQVCDKGGRWGLVAGLSEVPGGARRKWKNHFSLVKKAFYE